jgi:hypothetical protein
MAILTAETTDFQPKSVRNRQNIDFWSPTFGRFRTPPGALYRLYRPNGGAGQIAKPPYLQSHPPWQLTLKKLQFLYFIGMRNFPVQTGRISGQKLPEKGGPFFLTPVPSFCPIFRSFLVDLTSPRKCVPFVRWSSPWLIWRPETASLSPVTIRLHNSDFA